MATKIIPNPKQRQAIEHAQGPMLVLAGAGTGKTTVLVERIAWLIEQGHARPDEILAITFTENAAAELQARVERRLGRPDPSLGNTGPLWGPRGRAAIWAGTFHAYCFAILKRNKKDFFVLTQEDVYVFLRQRIEHLGLERFIKASDLGQFLDDLRSFFDRCHEELVSPDLFQAYVDSLHADMSLPRNCKSKEVEEKGPREILARWQEIARVYTNAVLLLEKENLGTFGMMISRAVGLLQSNPELLAQEQQRARFILIDEFQDSNSSNIALAELLGGAEQNIFAVGDPDQAIYRFRGASSAAFEEFQRRFPGTQGVVLDENQRSRGNILRVAFAAIEPNPQVRSLGGSVNFMRAPLESGRDRRDGEQGRFVFDDPVEAVIGLGDEQEAGDIAEAILRVRENARPREALSLAVLYRSHFHREKMIEALAARGIPFLVRGMTVTETPVVRDVLAVARAAGNESDADSLFRICALPQFAVVPEELRARLAGAGRDKTFRDVLENMEAGRRVLAAVHAAREFVSQQKLSASGALAYLVRQFTFPAGDPAIQALTRFARDWEAKPFIAAKSLQSFLDYLDLFQEGGGAVLLNSEDEQIRAEDENPDAVRLMTVHAAKGLEFSHVWILRVLAPGFPAQFRESLFEFPAALRSSVAIGEGKDVHEQEERRLFYVAITRARDRLAIHSRRGRGKDPTPPGFLRPLLQSRRLAASLQERAGAPGSKLGDATAEISPAGEWMLLPPAFPATGVALSAHAVESYAACPLKFKLEKDWRVPGEAAAAMQYGSAIHTVLRQYYDPSPGATELSDEDVIEVFREEFSKAVIDDPVQRALYEKMGAEQLQTLLRAQPRGSVDVIAAEVSFTFNLGAQKVTGRIDRLDRMEGNAVRVIDYKTGAVKTKRHAEESLQLSIYAMGAAAMGFEARELAFLNLQGNELQPTTRSGAQLQKARQRIEEAARGIAAQEFEARPGQHCQWCAYRRLCPATEQRVFIPARPLTETALKTAGVTG